MLVAHGGLAQDLRLVGGEQQDAAAVVCKGEIGGRLRVGHPRNGAELLAQLFARKLEAHQQLLHDLVALAQQAEEDVLGGDSLGSRPGRLVASEKESPPSPLGQVSSMPPRQWPRSVAVCVHSDRPGPRCASR